MKSKVDATISVVTSKRPRSSTDEIREATRLLRELMDERREAQAKMDEIAGQAQELRTTLARHEVHRLFQLLTEFGNMFTKSGQVGVLYQQIQEALIQVLSHDDKFMVNLTRYQVGDSPGLTFFKNYCDTVLRPGISLRTALRGLLKGDYPENPILEE